MSDKKTPVEIPADPEQAQALLARLQQAKKLCGLLGIAQKAGKVTAGTNLVTEAIRSGSPKKCPYAVFLASDASDFVNGHVLYVDGGILAYIGKQP